MDKSVVGKWVEVTLVNGKKWIGKLEEWDEDALFISNGNDFGAPGHKGAECTNDEVSTVLETAEREFTIS
jgi:hypothetical protein